MYFVLENRTALIALNKISWLLHVSIGSVIGRTLEAKFTVGAKANADVDAVMIVTHRQTREAPREKAISFRRKYNWTDSGEKDAV
jgi:hypothetical protein